MRICLVRCPSPFLIDDRAFPPLGLMAVATGLKQGGHDVTIYDGSFDTIPMDFEYYGFGATTPEYSYALEARKMIKAYNPDAWVVIGGSHVTLNPDSSLLDGFDCVTLGDGEVIAGEAFSRNFHKVVGEERPLDEYPITDRSLINLKNYTYRLNNRPATTMVTGRGCPYHCGFCCKNHSRVRFRSASKVIEEIEILYYSFGYEALVFPEDIFILQRKRTEDICKCLRKLGILWRCLVRADLMVKYSKSFAHMMADSGCVEVGMGVESGSPKILSTIQKGEEVSTIKEGIRILRDVGIRVKGFFILGLPGEDQETINETWAFLEEMQMDDVDIKIYQPYPGSPIWEHKPSYDIDWRNDLDYKDMFYKGRPRDYHGNVCTSSLTNQQIVDNWIKMEATFKRAN